MVLKGLDYQYGGIKENRYLYNGMEKVDDHNLNIYSAFYRNYDPTIGRWSQIDPKSEKYFSWSPYHGMGNNPIVRHNFNIYRVVFEDGYLNYFPIKNKDDLNNDLLSLIKEYIH